MSKELVGKTYCRTILEFVMAAELPQDVEFGGHLYLKGDFIVRKEDGTQQPKHKDEFLKEYQEVKEAVIVDRYAAQDTIDKDKRLIVLE